MDKIVYTKTPYNPSRISLPVPIIAHSDEIIIPVNVARELYPFLRNNRPLPIKLRLKLKQLFESSPTRI